jgi:tetraprenyl-beta-curcumene synthase
LSPGQVWALLAAIIRQLLWGLPAASAEVRAWRRRASAIPDRPIRSDALDSLARKRPHLDGAALFCTVPRRRNARLLRLLVAYEVALEFLDNTNEREHCTKPANGNQLHLALRETVTPHTQASDYYQHHPWEQDAGYLRALVEACREDWTSLPRHSTVERLVIVEVKRTRVLALNHDHDPARREASLREWTEQEFPAAEDVSWFERAGAATASLTVHALFALAAEATATTGHAESVQAAYCPWVSLTATMLDSYADHEEDTANGNHSYVAYYPSSEFAVRRISGLIRRSLSEVDALPRGDRHAVIVACMTALYLSRDSVRERKHRAASELLARSGGSLTRLLLPALRMWRVVYALRSA